MLRSPSSVLHRGGRDSAGPCDGSATIDDGSVPVARRGPSGAGLPQSRPVRWLDRMPTAIETPIHRSLGLTDGELQRIVELMGREPNHFELAVFSLLWSEHCGYKHSRPELRRLPDERRPRAAGPGRERGRDRRGRRPRARVQGREPQPPLRRRALPGRRDRRRRDPARHLRDGRAPDRDPRLAAARPARRGSPAAPVRRDRARRRRLRQLRRRRERRRRDGLRRRLPRQPARQRDGPRRARGGPARARVRGRGRQPDRAVRRADRPRRHRRRQRAGLPGSRRGERREAPLGADRRPVHRQEAARVLARAGRAARSSSRCRISAPRVSRRRSPRWPRAARSGSRSSSTRCRCARPGCSRSRS